MSDDHLTEDNLNEELKPEGIEEQLKETAADATESVELVADEAEEKIEAVAEETKSEETASEEITNEEPAADDTSEAAVEEEPANEESSTELVETEATDSEIEHGEEQEKVEATQEVVESPSEEEASTEVEASESDVAAEVSETETVVAPVTTEATSEGETQSEEAEVAVAPPPPVVDSGKRWYSLRVISGKERKIKERIELEIQRNKWSSAVSQVLVPSEKVYKIRSGKKVILERNILPGYILIEAFHKKFSPEIVQGIANIPNVIHFLGKTKPIPMQQSEANRMLGKVDESQEVGESLIEPYIVGETIKIIDGPFNGFVGDIKEVNDEKKKLKVIVKIFGRGTEVELNFMQVDKQS